MHGGASLNCDRRLSSAVPRWRAYTRVRWRLFEESILSHFRAVSAGANCFKPVYALPPLICVMVTHNPEAR